jgi:hypothetical protein
VVDDWDVEFLGEGQDLGGGIRSGMLLWWTVTVCCLRGEAAAAQVHNRRPSPLAATLFDGLGRNQAGASYPPTGNLFPYLETRYSHGLKSQTIIGSTSDRPLSRGIGMLPNSARLDRLSIVKRL